MVEGCRGGGIERWPDSGYILKSFFKFLKDFLKACMWGRIPKVGLNDWKDKGIRNYDEESYGTGLGTDEGRSEGQSEVVY